MARGIKMTHEEFVEKLSKINSNICVIGQYVNAKTDIRIICEIDNHEWLAKPYNLLSGKGCPMCMIKNKTFTHEDYLKKLKEINPDIQVLSLYKNSKTKIRVKCLVDGYEWSVFPGALLNGHGCCKCFKRKISKTHEYFVTEMKKINPNIEIIGDYINAKTKIRVKCLLDGY